MDSGADSVVNWHSQVADSVVNWCSQVVLFTHPILCIPFSNLGGKSKQKGIDELH